MKHYPGAALEQAMNVQEAILRAIGKRITSWMAAEISGDILPEHQALEVAESDGTG